MAKPSVVNLSLNTALALPPVEVGIYVKGKALLASGRKAFSIVDVGGDKDLAREAVGHLLNLGLVVHRGGGWYALARLPARRVPSSNLGGKMSSAVKVRTSRKPSSYEKLRGSLKKFAADICGHDLPASVYSVSNKANKARYRRIMKVVDGVGSTTEEFAQFVSRMDWSWAQGGYPGVGLISTDDFLSKFRWYVGHREEVESAGSVLAIYDKVFGYIGGHKFEDQLIALQLQSTLADRGVSPDQFFGYASSLQWRSFGGFPPFKFLASNGFVNQAHSVLNARGGGRSLKGADSYLGRIIDRLTRIALPLLVENFEDRNWEIGEAVFEPLAPFVANSGSQLKALVEKVVSGKDSPTLGFYLITYDAKLTPLAVYWIVYASSRLGDSFCPVALGIWKDLVKDLAADAVRLDILEATL